MTEEQWAQEVREQAEEVRTAFGPCSAMFECETVDEVAERLRTSYLDKGGVQEDFIVAELDDELLRATEDFRPVLLERVRSAFPSAVEHYERWRRFRAAILEGNED